MSNIIFAAISRKSLSETIIRLKKHSDISDDDNSMLNVADAVLRRDELTHRRDPSTYQALVALAESMVALNHRLASQGLPPPEPRPGSFADTIWNAESRPAKSRWAA